MVQGRTGCEGSQNVDGVGDIQRKGVCLILSNFNAVIVMPRLAEQPPDFNRLISSMRRRCQACVNAGGGHTRY